MKIIIETFYSIVVGGVSNVCHLVLDMGSPEKVGLTIRRLRIKSANNVRQSKAEPMTISGKGLLTPPLQEMMKIKNSVTFVTFVTF